MEGKDDDEPVSAIQKKIRKQKIRIRNQTDQQHDKLVPDSFDLEENIKKHEKKIYQ